MQEVNQKNTCPVRHTLEANNYFMRIEGSSMEPLLKKNDVIKVELVKPEEIVSGDLAVFTKGETSTLVCHRIIYISNRRGGLSFLEKGDNSMVVSLISDSQIIGRVKAIVSQTEIKNPICLYNPLLLGLLHSLFFHYAAFKGFIRNHIQIKEGSLLYSFYKALKKKMHFLLLRLFLRKKDVNTK